MKPKHKRLFWILMGIAGLGFATFFTLNVLRDSLVYFYMPSDLAHGEILSTTRIRMGGLVESKSLIREGEKVSFKIKDRKKRVLVIFEGVLPDLFREGQGVVVEGYLQEPSVFLAKSVLAKHDENYMPKEVADRLRQEGLNYNAW